MHAIDLPAVPATLHPSRGDIAAAIGIADALVRVGAVWSERKCFFRTYVAVSILRPRGLDVRMNVGLLGLDARRATAGHCWMTVDGIPLGETTNPRVDYPHFMGIGPNGVRYWIGVGTPRQEAA